MSRASDISGDDATLAAPGAAPPPPATATPVTPAPHVLGGRYELLGLLGSGGMGSVYRARDRELDELVALKMLRRDLIDAPGMLARFRQEVKLARRVTHRNVARTYDIGEHQGGKFLTMELVDGEPLSALLAREGALPLARVVELGRALCAGLSAAHAAGVVHRDLKPDNVLVAKDGRAVITDFGIARAALDAASLAKTAGLPLGTPAYMAPEQVLGAPDVDARADVYALGAMLYELLTGVRAWGGDSVYAVAAARLTTPPPDPRFVRPDLAPAVGAIVQRCMATRREDRYASVDEVAAALSALSADDARAASAPPPPLRARANDVAPRAMGDARAKTVAVLPLQNAGGPEDEYLADGITEDLIDVLSVSRGLRVRSRGAVMRFKGKIADPRTLGRDLGVQVVVEGSVRRAGERVRVSVRLVSVDDGFQIWARRFDRPAGEVLAVGDEAADAIAAALAVDREAAQRDAPTDPRALDLLLRGRHELHAFSREGVERALALFREALRLAPEEPRLLSSYAIALVRRLLFDESVEGTLDQATDAATRALAAAPDLGEARLALASLSLAIGDGRRAAEALRDALGAAPLLADAHEMLGRVLLEIGRARSGIARLEQASALEPRLAHLRWDIARGHALLGAWDEVDACFAAPPEHPELRNAYWTQRWRLCTWRGDPARAHALLDAIAASPPFSMRYAAEAILRVMLGEPIPDRGLAELDLRAAAPRARRRRAFFRQLKAEVLVLGGRRAEALDAIADVDDAGAFDVAWMDACPLLAPLRDDARFAALRARFAARAADVDRALGPVLAR